MSSWTNDLAYSLRALRRTPGFTATAIIVLGLGIGLNAGVFTALNALLFTPLGGKAPGELVGVYDRDRAHPDSYRRFSYPAYRRLREQPGALSGVLAQELTTVGLTDGETSSRAFAGLVSANYFEVLAVRPALGRSFRAEEERPGTPPVAIISDGYWRRHGADRAVIGRQVRVNGRDVAIVGVAPAGFSGAVAVASPDLWLPLGACSILGPADEEDANCLDAADRRDLAVVGRLPRGVSRAAAAASLAGHARALERDQAGAATEREIVVSRVSRLSIGSSPSGDSEATLAVVFLAGLALCVLLIASVNLANMLLARGTARRRELAIRFALGSSRWRAVRLMLIEASVLSVAGACVGLAVSAAVMRLLAAGVGGLLPFDLAFDARPDLRVVAATFGYALVAAAVCGPGPALGLARSATMASLKEQAGQAHSGTGRMSVRNVLVVFQLATSLALLTAAALCVRGALLAGYADPGFQVHDGLIATVSPDASGFGESRGRQAYDRVVARLRSMPGTASASLASSSPFGTDTEVASVRDAALGTRKDGDAVALVTVVGTDYFRTLSVPLLRGREFTSQEEQGRPGVRPVIVDKVLAARLWPETDPLGQRLRMEGPGGSWTEPLEVVGVAPSLRQGLDRQPPARLFLPAGGAYRGQVHLHVRLQASSRLPDAAALRAMRQAIRASDPRLAVLGVETLEGQQRRSPYLWIARAEALVFTGFGIAALILATLGVYGVKAYLVSQRRREIAIRMALGATRGGILRLIVGDGLVLTACGLALGAAVALGLSKVLESWVYGAAGLEPVPLATAALALAASMLLACYLPVRRAARATPWSALRAD